MAIATAYFKNRRGAACAKAVSTASEAKRVLSTGSHEARIESSDGVIVGRRWKQDGRWNWFCDLEWFK